METDPVSQYKEEKPGKPGHANASDERLPLRSKWPSPIAPSLSLSVSLLSLSAICLFSSLFSKVQAYIGFHQIGRWKAQIQGQAQGGKLVLVFFFSCFV